MAHFELYGFSKLAAPAHKLCESAVDIRNAFFSAFDRGSADFQADLLALEFVSPPSLSTPLLQNSIDTYTKNILNGPFEPRQIQLETVDDAKILLKGSHGLALFAQ